MDRRQFLVGAGALVLAPDTFARASGGTPVALVTADAESRVAVVDFTTGRILHWIRTPADPRSIESLGGARAVVAHTASGAVSIVDGRSLRLRAVVRAFGEPRYAAVALDGRHVHVTDSAREEVVTLDVVRARVVSRTRVDGPARHITLSRDGRRLWVALGTKAPEIAVLDARTAARPRVVGRVRPPFLAHDIAFTPGGRRVWVSSGDRRQLAIYDARTRRIVRTLAGDAPPQHVTFLGRLAYVTSGDDGLLRVHQLDGRLLRTTRVPLGSYNVQEAFGKILTPSLSEGTLSFVDPTGRVRRTVDVAASSHDACWVMTI